MDTNYKVALQTLRRILDEGFYNTEYAIEWIDLVLDGKQNPRSSMTREVENQFRAMASSKGDA